MEAPRWDSALLGHPDTNQERPPDLLYYFWSARLDMSRSPDADRSQSTSITLPNRPAAFRSMHLADDLLHRAAITAIIAIATTVQRTDLLYLGDLPSFLQNRRAASHGYA